MPSSSRDRYSGDDFHLEDYLIYTPDEEYVNYPKRVYGGRDRKKITDTKRKKQELISDITDIRPKIFQPFLLKVLF